jgi:eukaryotic-like serine/threonine-protein kinase
MTINPGTKLGPYEVLGTLGAGGMGEVFRAKDTRLGRDVAVKVLPEAFAQDADRLRRFEQEAKTIAALNHPNILGIHDIGTHEGRPYLVGELLEGETLREKVDAGALPVKRVIEYAQGIAQGLAAAHNKGIVHRDLKPENIFVTRDGRVKVLDFGLAKLVRSEEGAESAKTMTSPATMPGMVLGTMGYMSPEQVKGEASDARSDIFSFGAMLYEMLAGKRAFKRDTAAETMTAILREEPPELTDTGWQGPLGLQKILERCLEKSPERRFQSASDLGFAIEALSGSSTTMGSQAHGVMELKRSWWPWAAAVAGLVVIAAGAWFAGKFSGKKAPPKFTRLTYERGFVLSGRFAKDGQTVVYSARWKDDPVGVYSVRTEFPQSVRVGLPSASLLAISPSGDLELGVGPVVHTNYYSGMLAEAPMGGGTPREKIKDVISADYGPDGKALAVSRMANQKVQVEYPLGKVIFTTNGYADYVRVSPSGKEVAFVEHPVLDDDRGWIAVVDEPANHRQLTREYSTVQGLAWSRTGKEIWFTAGDQANRQMYGVSLGGKQREILAVPSGMLLLDIASDGRVLLATEERRGEINGIDPATGKERKGMEWFDGSGLGDVSRDGKAILFSEWGGPAGLLYLVVHRKLDGSAPTSLGEGAVPRFSPDETMAAAPLLSRPPKVAILPIGPGESRRLDLGDLATLRLVSWFPDGKHLLLLGAKEGEALRAYEMDLSGGKPEAVGPADFRGLEVAGDGKRIAGWNGKGEAVVFEKEKQKMQAIPGIAEQERINKWAEDGKALLVTKSTPWEAEVFRVEVETGKRTLLQKVEPGDRAGSNYNIGLWYAEKSKTYVYNLRRLVGNLYVVEGLE